MSTNHSTGPRTEEGKAKSAQNSRKHGLTAESVPDYLRPVFNDLRNELRAQCQPDGPLEEIFFDKLVTARWSMLRSLDLENELYDLSEGKDPLCHPATVKLAELYSRYYIRYEGSFNRAYKQLKDSQTNRICQLIEVNPEAPRPYLPLADSIKIQGFAKRTPTSASPGTGTGPNPDTGAATEARPSGDVPKAAESEDILNYYSPEEAETIRAAAEATGKTVNFIISETAKYGMDRMYHDKYGNEANPWKV